MIKKHQIFDKFFIKITINKNLQKIYDIWYKSCIDEKSNAHRTVTWIISNNNLDEEHH
jgi:hypothetical protein